MTAVILKCDCGLFFVVVKISLEKLAKERKQVLV